MTQPIRRNPDGPGFLCQAGGCDTPAVVAWSVRDGQGNTSPRYACGPHQFGDQDPVAGMVHESACAAPAPPCTCAPVAP